MAGSAASFGEYDVLDTVAVGATGTVYRARHRDLGRIVAIKELSPALRAMPGMVESLRSEAQMLAGLDHPNVVAVYDFGEDHERAWIAEEWVTGAALREILATHGRLSPEQALGVLRGALLGLAHAHERGLVHRDVAPGNILADEAGTSKLIDFGVAAPIGATGRYGTPAFVSPEAARGDAVGKPGDVYSAGAVLYTLLAGAPPYPASDPSIALRRHLEDPVPRLRGHGPDVAGVVAHAMVKDPAARPPDAAALLAELEEAARKKYGADWLARGSIVAAVATAMAARPAVTGTAAGAGAGAPGVAAETVVITAAAADTGRSPVATTAMTPPADPPPPPASTHQRRALRRPKGRTAAIAAGAVVAVVAASAGTAVALRSNSDKAPAAAVVPSPSPTLSPSPTAVVLDGPSGVYTFNVRIVKSTNSIQPAGTVLTGRWTFTSSCLTASSCTGTIVSSGGARYRFTYDGTTLVARGTRLSPCLNVTTGQPLPGTEDSYSEDIVNTLRVTRRAPAAPGHLGAPRVLAGTATQVQRNVRPQGNCATATTRQTRTVTATKVS